MDVLHMLPPVIRVPLRCGSRSHKEPPKPIWCGGLEAWGSHDVMFHSPVGHIGPRIAPYYRKKSGGNSAVRTRARTPEVIVELFELADRFVRMAAHVLRRHLTAAFLRPLSRQIWHSIYAAVLEIGQV